MAALREQIGARHLVGHSYGGLIVLEAACGDATLRKVAVYEPGVSVDGLIPMRWVPGYEGKLAQGRALDAFVEFCIAVGPRRAQRAPAWAMKLGMLLVMSPARRERMLRLLPANLLEHREVARLDNTWERYRDVSASTLLMVGGRSGLAWVPAAVERLTAVLPTSEVITFPKLDHFGPDRTGPHQVAQAVEAFFQA